MYGLALKSNLAEATAILHTHFTFPWLPTWDRRPWTLKQCSSITSSSRPAHFRYTFDLFFLSHHPVSHFHFICFGLPCRFFQFDSHLERFDILGSTRLVAIVTLVFRPNVNVLSFCQDSAWKMHVATRPVVPLWYQRSPLACQDYRSSATGSTTEHLCLRVELQPSFQLHTYGSSSYVTSTEALLLVDLEGHSQLVGFIYSMLARKSEEKTHSFSFHS